MSDYGADLTPSTSQAQAVARALNFAPAPGLHIDQYSYSASSRTFHLVDKRSRSSLWISTNPTELPAP
jgi:hypothetical protein